MTIVNSNVAAARLSALKLGKDVTSTIARLRQLKER